MILNRQASKQASRQAGKPLLYYQVKNICKFRKNISSLFTSLSNLTNTVTYLKLQT